jgi:hypothetical protein
LHQVGDLFELNVKLRCQKVNNTSEWPEGWLIAPSYGRFNFELFVFSENYS